MSDESMHISPEGEDAVKARKEREARKKLEEPDLLANINDEIGRNHVGDKQSRMLLFLCAGTTLLQPDNRLSVRVCGDSTAGKDNMIKSVLDLYPPFCFARFTGTSDKFLARLVDQRPGLYVGEVNLRRRGGANQNIIEILKACQEGGVSYGYLEPDERGRYQEKENRVERKAVIRSGTEISQDDELTNRELSIAVEGSEDQTREVINRLAEPEEGCISGEKESWVPLALSQLKRDVRVVIPSYIKEFLARECDKKNLRARRDFKRVMYLLRSCAFIHQRQRTVGNTAYVQFADLYYVLLALGDTLNQSYRSVEPRLNAVIDTIREIVPQTEDGWVKQQTVAEKAKIRGKNRQSDIFESLEDQLIIRRRPCPDDKRYNEVQLTGKLPGAFLVGDPLLLCKKAGALCPFRNAEALKILPKQGIPIREHSSELAATDSGNNAAQILPEYSPAIDFVTGKIIRFDELLSETDIGGNIGEYSTKEENLSGNNSGALLNDTDNENKKIGISDCSKRRGST